MRIVFFVVLIMACLAGAHDYSYVIGARNSRYAYIGFQLDEKIGVFFENSVYSQSFNHQYGRGILAYSYELSSRVEGNYALYVGSRYDQAFFDVGAIADVQVELVKPYLKAYLKYQPFYDSDQGVKNGILVETRLKVLTEVNLFAGFRNMPDFRQLEERIYSGLSLGSDHLIVRPEISITPDFDRSVRRFEISFVYKNFI